MFASVWQLLTAIFILSALVKIVCKLIKEDRAAGCSSAPRRRFLVVRANQEQVQLEQGRPADERQQQQQQHQQGPDQVSSASGGGQANETREFGAEQNGATLNYDDQLDEDDEFEETLSWAFQTPSERAQLEEQRRARWITRQRFRRQLNRLNVTAAGLEAAELDEQPDQVSDSGNNNDRDTSLQQLSPTSSGEFFDANEFSSANQNVAPHATTTTTTTTADSSEQDNRCQSGESIGPTQTHKFKQSARRQQLLLDEANSIGDEQVNERPSSVRARDRNHSEQRTDSTSAGSDLKPAPRSSSQQQQQKTTTTTSENLSFTELNTRRQQQHFDDGLGTASRQTIELTRLIVETFLLEPLKLSCAILGHTFRNFCAFLDFIEGIESSPPTTSSGDQTEESSGSAIVSSGGVKSAALRQLAAGNSSQKQRRTAPAQLAQSTPRGRSNYFHRRYVSRRSLIAALLNDSDEADDSDRATSGFV